MMPPGADFPPLRIGVAGLGLAGRHHVERLGLREDCRVVALYDDCLAARERSALPRATMHAAWDGFLGDQNVELVLLAAPPAVHAELALAALAAGKHLLIETPLGLSSIEAEAVLAGSRRSGRSVVVAHTRRWDDDFRVALATLASGELGRPFTFKRINWHYNPRPARGPNAGATAAGADWHWRDHAHSGGGVLWEFGVHYFDQLLQLTDRRAESVFGRVWTPPGAESDDAFVAIVNFAGGISAQVEVNRSAGAPLSTGWMVAGTSGSYAEAVKYLPTPQGEVVDLPVEPPPPASDAFYSDLVRHIRLGEPNPVPADEAQSAIALVEAVRESSRTGEVVRMAFAQ